MHRITDNVNLRFPNDIGILLQEIHRVVSPHSTSLHEPHEREFIVRGGLIAPTAYVAIKEELSALNARRPKVSSGRNNLEFANQVVEGLDFGALLVTGFDEVDVPDRDAGDGFLPTFLFAVGLGSGIGAVIDDFSARSPVRQVTDSLHFHVSFSNTQ